MSAARKKAHRSPLRTTRGRPKLEEADDRSEALLDAATKVFLERGYAGASTREITRTAGASKETLYQRFPTKASLFAALIERKSGALLASMDEVLQVENDALGALTRFGEQLLTTMMHPETQKLHQVVIAEARDFPELAQAFWEKGPGRGRELLKKYLGELVKQQRMRSEDVEFAAEQFLGALVGAVSLRTTLAIPNFLPDAESIRLWAKRTAEAFLRAHMVEGDTAAEKVPRVRQTSE